MLTLRPIRMTVIDITGVAQASAQDQAEANMLQSGIDDHGNWHRPRDMRNAIAAEQLPILDRAKRVLISSSVVMAGSLALIWTIVHFAQKVGLPW